ncbi:MAG: GGDEF domain-containing protein [Alphaproteobacteria bacterium]|nr:MAG: GGDEF domain-containing protein [Alphaproteobacteria bacterium]
MHSTSSQPRAAAGSSGADRSRGGGAAPSRPPSQRPRRGVPLRRLGRTLLGAARAPLSALRSACAALRCQLGAGWLTLLLIPATVGGILVVTQAPSAIARRILLDDMSAKALIWERRVLSLLNGGAEAIRGELLSDEDDSELHLYTRVTDIYRMRVFSAQGDLIWSSHHPDERSGAALIDPGAFEEVRAGRVVATLDDKPLSEVDRIDEALAAPSATRKVSEIYVPVLGAGGFVGAIEFYSDVTRSWSALLERLRLMVGALVGTGLAILYVGIGWLVRSSRRRMAEMRARAEADQEAMARQVRMARDVQLLGELNEWLQSAASLDELFGMVSRFLTHLLPEAEGAIYVYSNSRDVLDGWAAWNGGEVRDHIRPDSCWGLRRGRTYTYGAAEVNFACEHTEPHDGRPYFCFPILAHGETIGLMHLRARPGETLASFRSCQRLAQMCAEQISMAIANVKMRDQLREQSIRDPLTGLYNRRHMGETLRRLIERSRRNEEPVSVLAIDVDHFKRFNDNHGHDAGDLVLRAVAEVLDAAADGDAIACRPGGEEFTLVLPGLDTRAAAELAERIRSEVAALSIRYGDHTLPRITISVGVATAPEHGLTVADLLSAADAALYRAKDSGRDRVEIACTDAPPAAGSVTALPKRQGAAPAPAAAGGA